MKQSDPIAIAHAAVILKQGGLVAFPTETVYGLGADAANTAALQKLFAAKRRPADHPVIVHVGHPAQLQDWTVDIPDTAYALADAFWPGPLTLILTKAPHVPDTVTGGQDTIGVRIPSHPTALALLNAFGGGIAAPSANRFGQLSPTRSEDLDPVLLEHVDALLHGDPGQIGLESTILDLSGEHPVLRRPGMLLKADLERVIGREIQMTASTSVRVPGSLTSHYAPRTPLQLAPGADLPSIIESLRLANPALRIAVLAHQWSPAELPDNLYLFSLPPIAEDYARQLYHALHRLDRHATNILLVETPPPHPAWSAVHDRLRRASAVPPPTASCQHDSFL